MVILYVHIYGSIKVINFKNNPQIPYCRVSLLFIHQNFTLLVSKVSKQNTMTFMVTFDSILYFTVGLNNSTTGESLVNGTSKLGCDYHKQSWCFDQPKIYLFQYIIGLYTLTLGYCASSLICYTMFSKILGPWPQVHMHVY